MNFAYSDEYMLLKMFIDSDDDMLKHIYSERVLEHNKKMENTYYDAGFDFYVSHYTPGYKLGYQDY